jgi:nitrate/nitrite transporter NarK
MTSLSKTYAQIFLSQGAAYSLRAGPIFTASFVCVGQWFVKRRGFAVGLASVGSSLGGFIYPLFFDRVIADVGFVAAMRWSCILVEVALGVGCVLVSARLPKKWDRMAR